MIVLGVDPGLAFTGWGIVAVKDGACRAYEWGVIRTLASADTPERLAEIERDVAELLATFEPGAVAIEENHFGRMFRASETQRAHGVIELVFERYGLAPKKYTPASVKQAVVGTGAAAKIEVAEAVQALFELEKLPRPNHAADALAVAYTYLVNEGLI